MNCDLEARHEAAAAGAATASRRERLIEAHLPLVRRLAHRYAQRAADVEDLEQAGSIGLIHAVDAFDAARGSSFEAYATPTIAGEILRYLRDRSSVVRVPRRVRAERAAIRDAELELTRTLGRRPSRRELAERLAWPVRDVDAALAATDARHPVPLTGDDAEPNAMIAGPDEWPATDDRISVELAMRSLAERDRALLRRRFFDDLSQCEIAREVGISQVQVSRRIGSALDRLRVHLDERVVARDRARS